MRCSLSLAIVLLLFAQHAFTQDNESIFDKIANLPNKVFSKIDNKEAQLEKKLDQQTEKALIALQKREARLNKKVAKNDSVQALQLFSGSDARYQMLEAKLHQPVSQTSGVVKDYIPKLDSLQTAYKFLQGNAMVSAGKLQQVSAASGQLQQLQGKLAVADEAQLYIRQREQLLRGQLGKLYAGEMLAINKVTYYYQAQLAGIKNMISDPEKYQEALLGAMNRVPAFQNFWQKNSYLSKLFPMPADEGTPQAMTGVQTRVQVQNELKQNLGITNLNLADKGGSGGGLNFLQKQLQGTQSALSAIKDKMSQFGGSSNMTMPDFQPNSQHTKSFMKRLQLSVTIQNTSSTPYTPAISNIGLVIGYKISDKATAGVGGSYLLGLGYGLNHIHFSSQGIGIRSFVDIKAKANIWITGGFEYQYMQQFASIQSIRNLDLWQKSLLVGLTKKYRIGKRENNVQLLYDLLANSEIPRGQPLVFRIGMGL